MKSMQATFSRWSETQTRSVGVRMTSAKDFGETIDRLSSLAGYLGNDPSSGWLHPLYVRTDHIVASQLSSFFAGPSW